MLRKIIFTLGLFLVSHLAFSGVTKVDGIAAVVNQGIILHSDIDKRLADLQERYADNLSVLPEETILREQLLEQLITERIQLQIAQNVGFIVTADELNAALEQYGKGRNIDISTLASADPERYLNIRSNMETQLLIAQIQRREIAKRFQINQREIDTFLNTRKGRAAKSTEYRFEYRRFISEAEAKAWATRLASPENAQTGTPPTDNAPTDLGFRLVTKLPTLIQTANVTQLAVGKTLPIIASSDAWHLFQLMEKRIANGKVIPQVHARHILVQSDAILTPDQALQLATSIKKQLDDGVDFAALAKIYSDDLATRNQGGDLGWSDPDNYVPEFTAALAKLSVGDISGVIESPFGWHIIQLLEKRQQDVAEQDLRNQVSQAIYQTRFQQELPRWLSEIRDNAYIERRL